MASSVIRFPSSIPMLTVSRLHHKHLTPWKSHPRISRSYHCTLSYSNTSRGEPAPVTYAPETDATLLPGNSNLFETMSSSDKPLEASITQTEPQLESSAINKPILQLQYLRKPLWLLGPTLLLLTGVVPTLWLPVSSVFLGANIASLLSLTGLDCIFNLGASLFLLMADSTARPNNTDRVCNSRPPPSYRFWNLAANVAGFIFPLALFLGSRKGLSFLQPEFPFISYAVVLGPYFLLLSIQIVTEMLTWHWRSPVWLVTPVVYEAYRLLQLMRGLKIGVELSAPGWMVHGMRGLVCCWVVVLGVQLMRVAWYAGFTARDYWQRSDDVAAMTTATTADG